MFDIGFLGTPPEQQEDGAFALRGRIVLGDFVEEFLASLDLWSPADYERQWLEAALRVLEDGHDRTAFLTSTYQFLWTMWRYGEELVVQEKLLVAETVRAPFDPDNLYEQIGDHERLSEDGSRISEWKVGVADLQAYLDRARKPARGRTRG